MRAEKQMLLQFPAHSENEALARAAVTAFITNLDPTMEEMDDIKTAVSEAVTNCIVHAYPSDAGSILLRAKLQDRTVEIVVRDQGVGIPDVSQARQPLFTTGGIERSGMGFTIMEQFMDSCEVHSVVGKGTVVRMRRTLAPTGDAL